MVLGAGFGGLTSVGAVLKTFWDELRLFNPVEIIMVLFPIITVLVYIYARVMSKRGDDL